MNVEQAYAAITEALAAIAPEVDLQTVDGAARLRDELDIDSMDFLGLVQSLHDSTGVDIPEADYGKVESLDGLVRYLTDRAA